MHNQGKFLLSLLFFKKIEMVIIENSRNLSAAMAKKFAILWRLAGNTPMLEVLYSYKGATRRLFVKCEHYNLTGSIKDRMALYILQKAYEEAMIKPGDRIIEATSGNTGISFSSIGKALGHPVTIIMPDWLSKERINIIKSLGAEIILVSKEQGGFLGLIELAESFATKSDAVFLPRQFENKYNAEAHEKTTAREIWTQLQKKGVRVDAFVAGVGTGGTVMGACAYFKKKSLYIKVHPLEPAESPTLSTGYKTGTHRIQGISDEFIPAIVELGKLDEIIKVSDGDAILIAQKVARQLGLAVGISSGANILGAIKVQNYLGVDATIATVIADSNKKYLSTDLMKEEPVAKDYLSPYVEFLDYTPMERLSEPN